MQTREKWMKERRKKIHTYRTMNTIFHSIFKDRSILYKIPLLQEFITAFLLFNYLPKYSHIEADGVKGKRFYMREKGEGLYERIVTCSSPFLFLSHFFFSFQNNKFTTSKFYLQHLYLKPSLWKLPHLSCIASFQIFFLTSIYIFASSH